MIRIVACLMFCAGLANADPLRIGTESDFQPFIFLDDEGVRDGFDVDLMDEICARGSFQCEWIEADFSTLFSKLAMGDFDIVVGGVGSTPERDKIVDWTRPYRYVDHGSSSFAALSSDLDPKTARISVQSGTLQESVLQSEGFETIGYRSNSDALDALLAGDVEIFFAATGYLRDVVDSGRANLVNLGEMTYPEDGSQIAIAKGKVKLRDRLNEIIEEMEADGTLTTLNAQWFPSARQEEL